MAVFNSYVSLPEGVVNKKWLLTKNILQISQNQPSSFFAGLKKQLAKH